VIDTERRRRALDVIDGVVVVVVVAEHAGNPGAHAREPTKEVTEEFTCRREVFF
jgi:hypothetical protein